ncbi:MAG: prolyl oligopeptidase family serine peptidase [Candidatus Cloacimonadales bacterium]
MRKIFIGLFLSLVLAVSALQYKEPAPYITEIFDTPRPPYLSMVNFSNLAIETNYQQYPSLEQLAEPTLKLAGMEISPRLNATIDNYPNNMIKLFDLETGQRRPVQLPESIKIRSRVFNHDYSKLALSYEAENGIKLLVIDIKTAKVKYLEGFYINVALAGGEISWLKDNKTILALSIPKREPRTEKPAIPTAPIIQTTQGKTSTIRTYQNLLQNASDKALFDYYFTSQPLLINSKNGKIKQIAEPAIYTSLAFSPDNNFILASKIEKPYSYLFPYYFFPRTYQILDKQGQLLKVLSQQPLQDEIPMGGTRDQPRSYHWQPLKPATLLWVEALDEGDPKNEVEHRDKVMRLAAPFQAEPEELWRTVHRFSGIEWSSSEDELIYYEYDRDTFWFYSYLLDLNDLQPQLLDERSYKDKYNDPGTLIKEKTASGNYVFIKRGEKVFYRGDGATPEGRYPFLSQYDLQSKEREIIFRSRENYYERFISFTSDQLDEIVILSESNQDWANYYKLDLESGQRQQITFHQNPNPEISELPNELINYTRADSIPLSGKLYLPPDHQPGERLPLIIHAYPREYSDANTAGQVSGTANSFPRFWGASLQYLVLEGYAVLQNASIPIIGDPETVNDNFIDQLNSSVKAAIDFLDEKELIDPQRVGIIGHSYGAFMVANVLAHSDLCATGIAKSGAYNRTLTPFGFQSERRTLWQAPEFYLRVSPFMAADKINEPLLLMHGEDDPNSGTYPLQSRRMYQALKGNGATARLVILPLEGHGYSARKSNLHVIAEYIEWFDKYLKNADQE